MSSLQNEYLLKEKQQEIKEIINSLSEEDAIKMLNFIEKMNQKITTRQQTKNILQRRVNKIRYQEKLKQFRDQRRNSQVEKNNIDKTTTE